MADLEKVQLWGESAEPVTKEVPLDENVIACIHVPDPKYNTSNHHLQVSQMLLKLADFTLQVMEPAIGRTQRASHSIFLMVILVNISLKLQQAKGAAEWCKVSMNQ